MASPYWGQLPGPKIVKHARRTSLDAPLGPRTNRASVQTTTSDAPTESTFSPDYSSPTASAFSPQGLAPGPSSFEPSAAASDRLPTKSSRRSSRNPDRGEQEAQNSHQSDRHPHGDGGLSYTQPAAREVVKQAKDSMEPDEYYTQRQNGRAQPQRAATFGSGQPESGDSSRRGPVSGSHRRRNMTKDEKRARVEAAERRARERYARETGQAVPATIPQQTSRESKRPVERYAEPEPSPSESIEPPREEYSSREAPVFREQPVAYAAPSRHEKAHRDDRRHDPEVYEEEVKPRSRIPVASDPRYVPEASLPKRNLSFRERAAAQDEERFAGEKESQPYQDEAPGPKERRFSLTRSGSNKLKKAPPGDPWYQVRKDPEDVGRESVEQPMLRAAPGVARNKELPPDPPITNPRRASVAQRGRAPSPAFDDQDDEEEENLRGIQRRATEPAQRKQAVVSEESYFPAMPTPRGKPVQYQPQPRAAETPQDRAARKRQQERDDDSSDESEKHHRISNMLYKDRQHMQPGEGLYKSPVWLEEWKKAPVGVLSGSLLIMADKVPQPRPEQNKAWWEEGGKRRSGSFSTRPRKAEAFDGEYDNTNTPTRFKPPLYLECGPLLRYAGMRNDKVPTRSSKGNTGERDRELWRGSVMIVTRDTESSYDIAPILRLFVQDIDLLPTPPHHVKGELSPEYVDPIAGHPKLGRRGETLYVRPVEHLEEGIDLSAVETDDGLFEKTRSGPDAAPSNGAADFPGTFAGRMKRIEVDGEKMQKYKDVRGFRLHTERGVTFWRFNIEVELREQQQRIAYRINRGPSMAFWVPAKGRSMNIMFHSCNGFGLDAKPDDLSGPDPMWRDVLNTHQASPFHVMVGGGDQIYNDGIVDECDLFIDWLDTSNPLHKHNAPFTSELQNELENYYLGHYCQWFSRGMFGLANSQIPMVNICNDHDIYESYGSYPYRGMKSPVMSGVGAVAFKYYMLFQHQSIIPETETSEQSWILGLTPGPYINELSRNVFVNLGSKVALLAADTRTERTEEDIISDKTWEKIMNRMYAEVRRGHVDHLLVVLPIPIAYPRLEWLENVLSSRVMGPVRALSRKGLLGKTFNGISGGHEVTDDLSEHWTAKSHKSERSIIIEDLQDLAIDKSIRVTVLSGDVQMAAVGQFYSNPKMNLVKHKDPRYMPNIISSGIANAPPPDVMADVLNRRHKVHHFDKQTDEGLIPIFQAGVNGKSRNNKRLLPHRNWCSIRQWEPGSTPPPTPPPPTQDVSESPPPSARKGGLLRRLSLSSSRPEVQSRESVKGPRPPISGGGGLFRSFSRRRNSVSDAERPPKLERTMSLGGGDSQKKGGFFSGLLRRNSQSRPPPEPYHEQWGPEGEEEDDDYYYEARPQGRAQPMSLRGGAANEEYSDGDESYFTSQPQPPRRAQTFAGPTSTQGQRGQEEFVPKPFMRTPTGLTTKQMRKAANFEVDLEGGLDICLNVEVNPKDPTGITVPYRMLVPKLVYEYNPDDELALEESPPEEPKGFKRLLSFRKKGPKQPAGMEDDGVYDEPEEYQRPQRQTQQGYLSGHPPQGFTPRGQSQGEFAQQYSPQRR